MNKKEYVMSFLEAAKKCDENIYKFFTKRTVITDLKQNTILSLDEFLNFIKNNINEDTLINRYFESRVCIKLELIAKNNLEMFFEIEDRRFSRIEINY